MLKITRRTGQINPFFCFVSKFSSSLPILKIKPILQTNINARRLIKFFCLCKDFPNLLSVCIQLTESPLPVRHLPAVSLYPIRLQPVQCRHTKFCFKTTSTPLQAVAFNDRQAACATKKTPSRVFFNI